jgi:hypothetical protein
MLAMIILVHFWMLYYIIFHNWAIYTHTKVQPAALH